MRKMIVLLGDVVVVVVVACHVGHGHRRSGGRKCARCDGTT